MDYAKRPIAWTAISLAFVIGGFFLFRAYAAPSLHGRHETVFLLAEKGMIAAAFTVLLAAMNGWRAAGFRKPAGRWWLLMGGVIWLPILGVIPGAAQFPINEPVLAAAYAMIALLVAFGEEGIFRGIMLHALERWSLWGAALLSSFFFGAVHMLALTHAPGNVFFFAQAGGAMGIGMLLAGLTIRYRSIYPAIFFHFLLDVSQFWNLGGIRAAIEKAHATLPPSQILLSAVVPIVFGGGWGALMVALEARRRAKQASA